MSDNPIRYGVILRSDNFKVGRPINVGRRSATHKMFQIASISKVITGIIVAKFCENGVLDYDTEINRYLNTWKCPQRGITLRMLLTHTSSARKSGFRGYPISTRSMPTPLETVVKWIRFEGRPGETEEYAGIGYQIIQLVIEDVTGKSLAWHINHIFDQLNLQQTTGKILRPTQRRYELAAYDDYNLFPETAAAGIWMSADDLMSILLDVCRSYRDDTGVVLHQTSARNMLSKQRGYRSALGPMVDTEPVLSFYHGGHNVGYRNSFVAYPDTGRCEIIMTHYNPIITDLDLGKIMQMHP